MEYIGVILFGTLLIFAVTIAIIRWALRLNEIVRHLKDDLKKQDEIIIEIRRFYRLIEDIAFRQPANE